MFGTPLGPAHRGERFALLRRALGAPRRFIRPWYLAYLLLGVVTAGLLPVLLPLSIERLAHSLATVAYVIGAYNFGLLSSPLWGLVAERSRGYRPLYLGSFMLTGTGIAALLLLGSLPGWLVAAFAIGAGSGGGATVATLFIVDFTPQTEWEPRIGWLQSFNAAGQVLGLVMAAAFCGGSPSAALWVAVALLGIAIGVGGAGLPRPADGPRTITRHRVHRHLDIRALAIFPKLSLPVGVGLHVFALNISGLRSFAQATRTPFGRFLLSWFLLAFAVAGFFSYFPLMLAHSYGLSARASALIYAATAAAGIALYVLCSRLSERYGSSRVYRAGLWLRLAGFLLLLIPFLRAGVDAEALGITGFALIVIAWPLLSVAGTDLAASLTPFSEGAAVGLLNAALALATALGIVCSGPLVARWGYVTIPATALAGLILSVLLARECRGTPREPVSLNNRAPPH